MLNEFLEGVFADCSEEEAAARTALLQEFVGACLIGDAVRYQRCLILYGEGGNGKSAVINLVRAMFPPGALASLPPQRWTERFALSALEAKLANFVSETPTGETLDGGAFKAVVTGDPVMAERKHRDPFEFRPVAGHMFSTNWPIAASDFSAGFWRRPMILPFARRFDTAPERKIAPEARVVEQELSGVVAWALECQFAGSWGHLTAFFAGSWGHPNRRRMGPPARGRDPVFRRVMGPASEVFRRVMGPARDAAVGI
ncbi:DUF5906 domain-containing protein [Sorangium sp. So ce128]|uniref:DUF5906 domain-containing protein n=1 Tax=Sorangium sp. So ce128 TaxID=3133281 RepID=UPI003F6043E5